MKISILTPDFSSNCFGRAWLLAKVLQRHYEIEIVGPIFGDGIWKPVADDKSINYKYVWIEKSSLFYLKASSLFREITGDVIYVSKPYMTSYGIGLLYKLIKKGPLVLDIDDWELGFCKGPYVELSLPKKIRNFISSFWDYSYYWNIFFMEKMVPLADEIIVSNSFLQKKFGGIIIPHGRDTELLAPERFDGKRLRKKFGLQDRQIISFIGSPRIHKGLEDLVEAISRLRRSDVALMLVGIGEGEREFLLWAKEKLGKQLIFFGEQSMTGIGEFLAASDLIVVPQRDSWATKGQTPAKIFDAMSMAKPIISTAVSNIPEILDNCGLVVEPGNVEELAEKIDLLLSDRDLASKLGENARKKCIEKYSWDAMEKILLKVFEKYE